MQDEDRPNPFTAPIADRHAGAASLLARENLDPLSQDELAARIALLEAEIARVRAHKASAAAHRHAAEALFRRSAG